MTRTSDGLTELETLLSEVSFTWGEADYRVGAGWSVYVHPWPAERTEEAGKLFDALITIEPLAEGQASLEDLRVRVHRGNTVYLADGDRVAADGNLWVRGLPCDGGPYRARLASSRPAEDAQGAARVREYILADRRVTVRFKEGRGSGALVTAESRAPELDGARVWIRLGSEETTIRVLAPAAAASAPQHTFGQDFACVLEDRTEFELTTAHHQAVRRELSALLLRMPAATSKGVHSQGQFVEVHLDPEPAEDGTCTVRVTVSSLIDDAQDVVAGLGLVLTGTAQGQPALQQFRRGRTNRWGRWAATGLHPGAYRLRLAEAVAMERRPLPGSLPSRPAREAIRAMGLRARGVNREVVLWTGESLDHTLEWALSLRDDGAHVLDVDADIPGAGPGVLYVDYAVVEGEPDSVVVLTSRRNDVAVPACGQLTATFDTYSYRYQGSVELPAGLTLPERCAVRVHVAGFDPPTTDSDTTGTE